MKTILFAILPAVLSLVLNACRESNETSSVVSSRTASEASSLEGSWELRHHEGGMLPSKDYPAGNGTYVSFSDSVYESYNDNVLEKKAKYSLTASKSMNENTPMDKLILEGEEDLEYRVLVKGDILVMEFGTGIAADGAIRRYERMKVTSESPD